MNSTVKSAIRTLPIHDEVLVSLWAECLHVVRDARNATVRAECTKASKKVLTGVKRSVTYLWTFHFEVGTGVPNRTRKDLQGKARHGISFAVYGLGTIE